LNLKSEHNKIVEMRYRREVLGGSIFLFVYIIFWFWFFRPTNVVSTKVNKIPQENKIVSYSPIVKNDATSVLGEQIVEATLPVGYEIPLELRRQFYNLSCEFGAASSIIFHFTNNPDFSVANEAGAEKTLINKVIISRNPNVGIRMGDNTTLENLYANLNMRFGGSEYYGIHAPPFFDLFENYKLISKPIYINDLTINSIQRAIYSGHLIMAWIKIGYEKSIDDSLSYGKVKIIKGEHAVVVSGYDENGVIIMDPGIGARRHISYTSFFNAAFLFPIPFLEVYKSLDGKTNDLIIGFDTPTEIMRSIPKIFVENGAGDAGVANQMRDILKDFGYNIVGISNADNFDYQNINIRSKKEFSDYLYLLKKDIKVASFVVASSSADLSDDSDKDIIVIVGK
jgi:hypothetical protein